VTDNLLDLIRTRTAGMTWQQVLVVRAVVTAELDAEISRNPATDQPGDGRKPPCPPSPGSTTQGEWGHPSPPRPSPDIGPRLSTAEKKAKPDPQLHETGATRE
jgi:hypothetical protein